MSNPPESVPDLVFLTTQRLNHHLGYRFSARLARNLRHRPAAHRPRLRQYLMDTHQLVRFPQGIDSFGDDGKSLAIMHLAGVNRWIPEHDRAQSMPVQERSIPDRADLSRREQPGMGDVLES